MTALNRVKLISLMLYCLVGCLVVGCRAAPPNVSQIEVRPSPDLSAGERATLTVDASGTALEFAWSVSRGTISGSGPSVVYTAPDTPGPDSVSVTVNSRGGEATRSVTLNVGDVTSGATPGGQEPTETPTTSGGATPVTQEPTETPSNGGGTLPPSPASETGFSVASFPSGGSVYILDQTTFDGLGSSRDAIDDAYYVGEAPLVEDLPAGSYVVAVEVTREAMEEAGLEVPPGTEVRFGWDGSELTSSTFDTGTPQRIDSVARFYMVSKSQGESGGLITLFIPLPPGESSSPPVFPSLSSIQFVSSANYEFSEEIMVQAIEDHFQQYGLFDTYERDVLNADRDEMIEVLHRVGKAVWSRGEGVSFIFMISDEDSFSILTYSR